MEKHLNVVQKKGTIFTVSSSPSVVYGERIIRDSGRFLREWKPERSKLSALYHKNNWAFPFRESSRVLYLGAASGTTVSHISDIVSSGMVYAVESSYDPFIKLLRLAEQRGNIIPILEDARMVEKYGFMVENPDIIYQDISQRDQVSIFNNAVSAWKSIHHGFLVLKIRSISFSTDEEKVVRESISALKGMKVVSVTDLQPFHSGTRIIYMERTLA
ncbi:MAG: fibrillarin-like rRNA/tRNA 2'-O-methyltransferase [Candidatus Thermoplasmatota archaeon]|nr:fibrillarin-like rRNA/tRNA 2'-O-methyltransferase [Candidatus Thermoplasmatota archaeon]MCL5731111.1 fibrillarin-like rRNA/tRNA 2'-O-methyltransferase [Candidatus Thermoplasmatota archaeon]